jgi:hypothetical protein
MRYRYSIDTGIKKLKSYKKRIAFGTLALAAPLAMAVSSGAGAVISQNYSLYGDAQIVAPGNGSAHAAQARSDGTIAPHYGGVNYTVPAGSTLANLNTLSTDYQMTQGNCGGGAPRFSVSVTNGSVSGNIFVYLGTPPSFNSCSATWTNTGNLATSATSVDATQVGGTFYDTYGNVQTNYGSYTITGISFDVDAYWANGTQTVQIDNTQINDQTFDYEVVPTKDTCKNNGWKTMTNPGPFKNQGDCVSYFATKGRNLPNGQ